jgi:hypothetical protein
MKGRLTKRQLGWVIEYQELDPLYPLIPINKLDKKEILLHPSDDDVDLIEGKEVDFVIDQFWEHGLEQVYKVARLTTPKTTSEKYKEYQDWLNEQPELSDEEITKLVNEHVLYNDSKRQWVIEGMKLYREQISLKADKK